MPARSASTKRSAALQTTKRSRGPLGWQTSDEDERQRRVQRGQRAEGLAWQALEPSLAPLGRHLVSLDDRPVEAGYVVELRGFDDQAINGCSCIDFRINGLGTCKHIEALRHARRRQRNKRPSRRVTEIVLDRREQPPRLRAADLGTWRATRLPDSLSGLDGAPVFSVARADEILLALESLSPGQRRRFRLAESLAEHIEKTRAQERLAKRLRRITDGDATDAIRLKLPLYPYQREGMLHLVTRRRAILADEMGLGKTVQAIAACALLARLGLVSRVLVVSPASLKSEWAEQIALFSDLPLRIVEGPVGERQQAYAEGAFFTLTNYEQILRDEHRVINDLAPDVIVLDEAQRIKNWRSKTAEAIKRLPSDYAFVLTGTPLENRIDEIYSIMQIVDPAVLGPLFRFNRSYHVLNERGAPEGYKNLDRLHATLRPHVLRRSKHQVEGDLPPCSVRTLMIPMSDEQRDVYAIHEGKVARLMAIGKRRPLLPDEMKRLQIALACMRMSCDSGYILDSDLQAAPKLDAFEPLLDELLAGDHKLVVFSEWIRMLELLQRRLDAKGIDYALHTGSVAQKRRRVEIDRFKKDPGCRLFLSSESGGAGLNLQVADVVVNLDLPWNPAKLSQRIARAWRKHQTRSVQVLNFVAEHSIEQGMLARLEGKQRLADGVLDGGIAAMDLPSGRGALMSQLDELVDQEHVSAFRSDRDAIPSADAADGDAPEWSPAAAVSTTLRDLLGAALQRFDPALRRVDILMTNQRRTLFVGAVAEHDEIERWLKARLEFSEQIGGQGDKAEYHSHVTTPEFMAALFELSDGGALGVSGRRQVLVMDGELVVDEVLLDEPLLGPTGRSDAERDRAMRQAVRQVIEVHRRTLEAAAMLIDGGFDEQGELLAAPVRESLSEALQALESDHRLPDDLCTRTWDVSPPPIERFLEFE